MSDQSELDSQSDSLTETSSDLSESLDDIEDLKKEYIMIIKNTSEMIRVLKGMHDKVTGICVMINENKHSLADLIIE